MDRTDAELAFGSLLEKVLKEWPDSIDASRIWFTQGRPDLYTVVALSDLRDSVANVLDPETSDVFLCNLNSSLFWIAHEAALYCTEIKPSLLRRETIRKNFDKKLLTAVNDSDLGWPDEHKAQIQRYFQLNSEK